MYAIAVLAIALTAGQACSAGRSTPSRLRLAPCTLGTVSARCGTLSVPENRATGTGRTIPLRVAVVAAIGVPRAPDPVFWLAGGPGGAATDSAAAATGLMANVNVHRDLVLVDQRGTGGSNDLRCPQGSDASRWADELRTCLAHLDGDPRAYTTAWAMDDLDDVRAALGYDRINLYGISYGATAAQVYLQRHPGHVRTALLESGTVLDVPIYERFPTASQHALDQLFARCTADPGCHAAYPDPAADLRAITARLDRGPITTKLTDPATGQPVQVVRQGLGQLLLSLLSDLQTAAVLPRLLRSAARDDWSDAVAALPRPSADGTAPTWQLMSMTINCHEPEERLRRAETEVAAAGSFLSYDDMRMMINPNGVCEALPAPPPAAIHAPLGTSPVPMLLINGAADPKDPPANVAGASRVYPNSLALTVPNQAHDYHEYPACRAALFAAFIDSAATTGLPTQCLLQRPAPAFDLG
jgi:pimeloyl-ACP methyl ester carboxylesterase